MGHSTRLTPTYLPYSFPMMQSGDVRSQVCTYTGNVIHTASGRLLAISKMAALWGSTLAKGLHGYPSNMEPCQKSQCSSCLHMLQLGLGIKPKPRCMPLSGNQTRDPSVHKPMLQPLRTAASAHQRAHERFLWARPGSCVCHCAHAIDQNCHMSTCHCKGGWESE